MCKGCPSFVPPRHKAPLTFDAEGCISKGELLEADAVDGHGLALDHVGAQLFHLFLHSQSGGQQRERGNLH